MEALLACCLISLDKIPEDCSIGGVDEILRQIAGRVVIEATRNDVIISVKSL